MTSLVDRPAAVRRIEPATCPACSSRNAKLWRSDINGYAIDVCSDCGTAYAWPRPTDEVLAATYSEEYYNAPDGAATGYADYFFLPEINAQAQWDPLQRYLKRRHTAAIRSVLDIGCATGAFLAKAAAAGCEVYGTDFSSTAIARAREHYGVEAESGVFAPAHTTRAFDLVTMWHVLEHVVDPVTAVRSIRPFVADDGLLFVELPSWNSAGRFARREHWSSLRPPEHITFFTPSSLAEMVGRCGFEVLNSRGIYPGVNLRQVPRKQQPRIAVRNVVKSALGRTGVGGYIRLVARPA